MIDVVAGVVLAGFVWEICWQVGYLRDDQRVKESGPLVGAAVGGLAIAAIYLLYPPTAAGYPNGADVSVHWALTRGVHATLFSLILLIPIEYEIVSEYRRHHGLLFGGKLTRSGHQ